MGGGGVLGVTVMGWVWGRWDLWWWWGCDDRVERRERGMREKKKGKKLDNFDICYYVINRSKIK